MLNGFDSKATWVGKVGGETPPFEERQCSAKNGKMTEAQNPPKSNIEIEDRKDRIWTFAEEPTSCRVGT